MDGNDCDGTLENFVASWHHCSVSWACWWLHICYLLKLIKRFILKWVDYILCKLYLKKKKWLKSVMPQVVFYHFCCSASWDPVCIKLFLLTRMKARSIRCPVKDLRIIVILNIYQLLITLSASVVLINFVFSGALWGANRNTLILQMRKFGLRNIIQLI